MDSNIPFVIQRVKTFSSLKTSIWVRFLHCSLKHSRAAAAQHSYPEESCITVAAALMIGTGNSTRRVRVPGTRRDSGNPGTPPIHKQSRGRRLGDSVVWWVSKRRPLDATLAVNYSTTTTTTLYVWISTSGSVPFRSVPPVHNHSTHSFVILGQLLDVSSLMHRLKLTRLLIV